MNHNLDIHFNLFPFFDHIKVRLIPFSAFLYFSFALSYLWISILIFTLTHSMEKSILASLASVWIRTTLVIHLESTISIQWSIWLCLHNWMPQNQMSIGTTRTRVMWDRGTPHSFSTCHAMPCHACLMMAYMACTKETLWGHIEMEFNSVGHVSRLH